MVSMTRSSRVAKATLRCNYQLEALIVVLKAIPLLLTVIQRRDADLTLVQGRDAGMVPQLEPLAVPPQHHHGQRCCPPAMVHDSRHRGKPAREDP